MRHVQFVLMSLLLVIGLTACGIGIGGLTTGVDGCTSLRIDEGQLSVPTVFSANGKGIRWHKVNEKCKDVPYHGAALLPQEKTHE